MKNRITPVLILDLKPNEIFVFGSNLKGIHGKGAALTARRWGAEIGIGLGMCGQTYAIPTESTPYKPLSLYDISLYITQFIWLASNHNPDLTFLVTPIGCNNAGCTPQQIARLFTKAIPVNNIWLPESFWEVLNNKTYC